MGFESKDKLSLQVATCYSTLASCYRELNQYEKALGYCSQAININKIKCGEGSEDLKKLNEKYNDIQTKLFFKECAKITSLKQ